MEGELSGIKNERQIAWFGFSAVSFNDCVFNAFVDSWEEVCNEEFRGKLKKFNEKARVDFLSFPFLDKSMEKLFKMMKRYCVSDIFNLPDSVTLPECKQMQIAAAKEATKNQAQAEKELAAKLEQIRLLRIKIVERRNHIVAVNESIEVLHEMEKGEEQLIKRKNKVLDSPARKMSPV
ncbi:unnamed protein product [Caenorhabditis sp. 36 PRJEB53466]|nr:unnamed protein product [Caenorhabditis sp. 36 PRJEB53466]